MAFHHDEEALVCIGCYTTFDNLAHKPRGTPSPHSIHTLRFDAKTGVLTPLAVLNGVCNPAFLRYHPKRRILYALTENIYQPGEVHALGVDPSDGRLESLGHQSAHGSSTCYLSFDEQLERILMVNYWDSSLSVCPINQDGLVQPACSVLPPPARVHCQSLEDHLANRQSEPHNHAIVLAPRNVNSSNSCNTLAFVPDLGTDRIRFYSYSHQTGELVAAGSVACAPPEGGPHGPRYIEFDPRTNAAYVVNELSSLVSVFTFDPAAAAALADAPDKPPAAPVLKLVQLISTRADPAPHTKNTCGRICVDPSGTHVLVSNRGDDSIACYKIVRTRSDHPSGATTKAPAPTLRLVDITPTQGRTPRHFQFAGSRNLIVANQDSDCVCVFRFDPNSGAVDFTGHKYAVNSPSFVAAQPRNHSNHVPQHIAPSNSLEF